MSPARDDRSTARRAALSRRPLVLVALVLGAIAAAVLLKMSSPSQAPTSARSGPPIDPRAVAPPAMPLRVGLSANLRSFSGDELDERAAAVRSAGALWVREDLAWSQAEPEPGRLDWRRYDELMVATNRAGLRVLPLVNDTPDWAGQGSAAPPDNPERFGRFVAASVARYGPEGTFWRAHPELDASLAPEMFEIWNEPYLRQFWAPRPDPAAYARLFAAAARAGSAANPRARFMLSGETVTRGELVGRPFLEAAYDAVPELPALTDAVSIHPYAGDSSGPTRWEPQSSERDDQVRRVELLRATMVRRGDAPDPIWITEIGWHTAPDDDGVSEQQQARYLDEVFGLARGRWRGYVRALFWYNFEGPESSPADREQWFGLRRTDGRPKAALEAFRRRAG